MDLDLDTVRKLLLASKKNILNINKELKELKDDIAEELVELKEVLDKVSIKNEPKIHEEHTVGKETGLVVKFDEEDNENNFCDVSLACDDNHLKILFHCDKCPAKFMLRKVLRKHISTHIEIRVYSCKLCQKLFSHKSELDEHMEKQYNKFSFECFDLKVLQYDAIKGRSLILKNNQNFIFQVF